jgi:hypothetical protein
VDERRLVVDEDDGEAVAAGVRGLFEDLITGENPVFFAAVDEAVQVRLGVQPAAVFLRPEFEVPFVAALKNSSLARRCCSI